MATFGTDTHGYSKIFQELNQVFSTYQSSDRRSFAGDLFIDAMTITSRPATTPFAYMLVPTSTHIWFADESNFGPKMADPVYVAKTYANNKQGYYFWNGSSLETLPTVEQLQARLAYAESQWQAKAEAAQIFAGGSAHGYEDDDELDCFSK